MSMFGSRSRAAGAVTRSKKLILSSAGRGAKGHGDSPLCFVCSYVNWEHAQAGQSEDYWGRRSTVLGGRLRFDALSHIGGEYRLNGAQSIPGKIPWHGSCVLLHSSR